MEDWKSKNKKKNIMNNFRRPNKITMKMKLKKLRMKKKLNQKNVQA